MSKIGAALLAIGLALCGMVTIEEESRAAQAKRASAQLVTSGPDALIEQGSYVNSDGLSIHRPAHTLSGDPPAGASAQCADGSYSFSMHHRGTCNDHGGVSRWLP